MTKVGARRTSETLGSLRCAAGESPSAMAARVGRNFRYGVLVFMEVTRSGTKGEGGRRKDETVRGQWLEVRGQFSAVRCRLSAFRGQFSFARIRGKHDRRVARGGMSEPARVGPVPGGGADHDRDDKEREKNQEEVKEAGTPGRVGVDFRWHGE